VASGHVTFTAGNPSPLERHLFRVALAGGDPERLTQEPGLHDGAVSSDGAWLVDVHDSRRRAPSVAVRGARETRVVHGPAKVDLPAPEAIKLKSRDGVELHGALYRPIGLSGTAPLICAVYGGPHVQYVQDGWLLTVDLRAQYLASKGFLVLRLDNRGSARRGHAFEAAVHRNMGDVEVQDQADGVAHLVELGLADPARVGIYGWSYGGYLTLMALARAPEVFKVGVSGAPVVEWEGYDTHYTERYMDLLDANPEGYRMASVLTHAARITGKLLLIHGMIDENVHFRHATRLMDALVKANIPHDLMLFPDERHMPRGERDRVSMEARVVEYFERHLKD
jgi:dipeptidyl-peptidase-4